MAMVHGLRILVLSLGMGVIGSVFAAEAPKNDEASSSQEMSFDEFLTTFIDLVPKEVCEGFKGDTEVWPIMVKKNITLEKCVELTKVLTENCVEKYKNKLPKDFDNELLTKWSKQVGYCIGLEYASKYIYNEDYTNTPPEKMSPKDESVTASPSKE